MMIGVTGTIGSGKSLVARLLGEMLPAPVYSSDQICRQLLSKGEAGYQDFVERWGDRFLDDSGEIDRVLLRAAVFDNDAIRIELENILHPLVRQKLLAIKDQRQPPPVCVAEVPLLFECGWRSDFDAVVCVIADREVALERVVRRDMLRREDIEKIFDLQIDPAVKAGQSDWVVDNSESIEQTARQVAALADALRARVDGDAGGRFP